MIYYESSDKTRTSFCEGIQTEGVWRVGPGSRSLSGRRSVGTAVCTCQTGPHPPDHAANAWPSQTTQLGCDPQATENYCTKPEKHMLTFVLAYIL